jgi:hypothetical protein
MAVATNMSRETQNRRIRWWLEHDPKTCKRRAAPIDMKRLVTDADLRLSLLIWDHEMVMRLARGEEAWVPPPPPSPGRGVSVC